MIRENIVFFEDDFRVAYDGFFHPIIVSSASMLKSHTVQQAREILAMFPRLQAVNCRLGAKIYFEIILGSLKITAKLILSSAIA
ncbi:MAG: hypothetical protein ABIG95_02930 [Candidatus Woesearchaeota archaeon]